MNIGLKGIPPGEWRQLEQHEISEIMHAIADSTSEAKPPKRDAKSVNPVKPTKPTNQNNDRRPPTAERSKAAKQMDRATNPNPKSKDLRGQSAANPTKKGGRGAAGSFSKPSKGRGAKR